MARFDRATGRYVHLILSGIEHRVYFEESGTGIPHVYTAADRLGFRAGAQPQGLGPSLRPVSTSLARV